MGDLNTSLLEEVSTDVFDGTVYRTKVDSLDDMFLSNVDNFTDSGIVSFFRTCKIPSPKFFLEKPREYVKETFLNQKANLRDKGDILLLVRDGGIVFASNDTGIEQEDPTVKFDLDGWDMIGEDLLKGYRRYVYVPKDIEAGDFISTSYMNVPLLYNGKMTVEVGLFRVICSNGMVTQVGEGSNLKIPQETYSNHLLFEPFMSGILSGLINSNDAYNDFLDYLTNKKLPDFERLKDRLQIMTEDKVISKPIAILATRHLDIIEKNEVVSDITLPSSMDNMMDFTNLLTRFAQESKTLSQQVKIEKTVFDYMYNQYKEEVKKEITPLNLEELLENLNAKAPELLEGAMG